MSFSVHLTSLAGPESFLINRERAVATLNCVWNQNLGWNKSQNCWPLCNIITLPGFHQQSSATAFTAVRKSIAVFFFLLASGQEESNAAIVWSWKLVRTFAPGAPLPRLSGPIQVLPLGRLLCLSLGQFLGSLFELWFLIPAWFQCQSFWEQRESQESFPWSIPHNSLATTLYLELHVELAGAASPDPISSWTQQQWHASPYRSRSCQRTSAQCVLAWCQTLHPAAGSLAGRAEIQLLVETCPVMLAIFYMDLAHPQMLWPIWMNPSAMAVPSLV